VRAFRWIDSIEIAWGEWICPIGCVCRWRRVALLWLSCWEGGWGYGEHFRRHGRSRVGYEY